VERRKEGRREGRKVVCMNRGLDMEKICWHAGERAMGSKCHM
jgi:hypothetical protein